MVISRILKPADERGYREPIKIFGKALAQSDEPAMRKIFENAKKRMLKCCPPAHLELKPWKRTGEQDHNGVDIWKPRFHSCGTENWNSQQTSFVVGGNSRKELATACYYEGNGALITKKEVAAGRQEELRTSNPAVALRCNAWAAHSGHSEQHGGAPRHRLLQRAPFYIHLPPLPAEGEVCIQQLGRFDEGSTRRKTPPALYLQFAPSVSLALPLKAQLQLQLATKQQQQQQPQLPPPPPPPAPSSQAIANSPATTSTPATSTPTATAFNGWFASAKELASLPQRQPPSAPKRKYVAKRKRVEGRSCEQNPWWCVCLKPASERTSGGRTYHRSDCPIERWLVDETFGAPTVGEELTAAATAGSRAGKRARFDGRSWVEE